MKKLFTACMFTGLLLGANAQSHRLQLKNIPVVQKKDKVQIMFLGSPHFGQDAYHKDLPTADLLSVQRQKEVAAFNQQLAQYRPDMIMIETTPGDQAGVDSLYHRYKTGSLALQELDYCRAERYQFGFKLGNMLQHDRIYGVDYYENVSNRMLKSGDNIEAYQDALANFNKIMGEPDKAYKNGTLSLKDFLKFINHPKILDYTYQVIYVTPAKVRNAAFMEPPLQYVDTAYTNKAYIGAEFISIFYERELKIYSNIITQQKAQNAKRLLVIMGQRHAAALLKIFANDPAYSIIPLSKFVN